MLQTIHVSFDRGQQCLALNRVLILAKYFIFIDSSVDEKSMLPLELNLNVQRSSKAYVRFKLQ